MDIGIPALVEPPVRHDTGGALVPPNDPPAAAEPGGSGSPRPVSTPSRDGDSVQLSPAAVEASRTLTGEPAHDAASDQGGQPDHQEGSSGGTGDPASDADTREGAAESEAPATPADKGANGEALTEEEQDQVEELQKRDAEVRRHEAAHKSAAGAYAKGGPTFDYQQGPDGKRYAIGGSVQIDSSPIKGDPQATIQKMQVVRRAALAPGDPSSQDRAVAAQAARAAQQAQQELREQTAEETTNANGTDSPQGQSADGSTGTDPNVSGGTGQTEPAPSDPDQQQPTGELVDTIA